MKVKLIDILQKTQEQLLDYTVCRLEERGYARKITKTKDYVFAQGNIPVLLVAHLDTVHKQLPEVYYDREKEVLWSPQGIGGDDRCGVYAILKICEHCNPYVLFTTDEEIGSKGAEKFVKEIDEKTMKKINFMIEIDRRGYNEAVFYDCGNEDFKNMILSYGFEEEFGSFSDISVLSPAFDIASVNLSAGYFNEHTTNEIIRIDYLMHTLYNIEKILLSKDVNTKYDFQEEFNSYYSYLYGDNYGKNGYSSLRTLIEDDWENVSDDEWFDYYGEEKPKTKEELNDFILNFNGFN